MSTTAQQPPPPPAGSDPSRGRSGHRALNEIRRTDATQGPPDRSFPPSVAQFYQCDGNSYRSAHIPEKIEFVDRGNRLHAYNPVSAFTRRTLLETAQARGWQSLEVTGSERFRQGAYIEAASLGMQVSGYTPTEKDAEILARRQERKAAHESPMVRAYLDADTKAQRTAAMKKYPQLKPAFASEAAAQAFVNEHIDSKKAAVNWMGKFRDDIAIALHTGRTLPSVGVVRNEPAAKQEQSKDQGRAQ